MGSRDKPYKTFFQLIKIKQQTEAMSLLITAISATIEDDGEIIEEVEHFYSSLCSTSGSSPEVLAAREEIISLVSTRITEEQR